jgi:coenzyme F420-reducing hydrogenase delta subunit
MLKELYIEPERIELEWFSIGESANITKAITDHVKELEKKEPTKK